MKLIVLATAVLLSVSFTSSAQWNTSGNDIYNSNIGDVSIGADNSVQTGYGTKLNLIGVSSNTDALWLARYNYGYNQSQLRVNIGDDYGANEDIFVVGTHHWSNGFWYPHLSVHASGRVGIRTTNPDAELTVVGGGHFVKTVPWGTAETWVNYSSDPAIRGLHVEAHSSPGYSYAVAGYASSSTGQSVGILGSGAGGSVSYAGYFNGNLGYTGILGHASDEKFKENISDLESSLGRIISLVPKEYNFKKLNGYNFPSGRRPGFIAQQFRLVFPELVSDASHLIVEKDSSKTRSETYLSVDYVSLIPHIVKAIQEQNKVIEEYKKSVVLLQDVILNQKSQISSETSTDIPRIVELFPNPTSSLLTVTIHNPSSEKASIFIKDKNGLNRMEVNIESTKESILSTAGLDNGVYLIELMVNNVSFDIRRFIVLK